MKTTYYKDRAGKHRWRITGKNGEIVGASSQGFASKQKAEENLELVWKAIHEKK